jgi:hypothetical protein
MAKVKISELKPPDKKNTTQQGGVLFVSRDSNRA